MDKLDFIDSLVVSIEEYIYLVKKKLNIDILGYRKFLITGDSFGFSSDRDWNITFSKMFVGKNIAAYDVELLEHLTTKNKYFIRSDVPNKNNYYFNILYEENIWNTLSVYNRTSKDGSIEGFYFCSNRDNKNILNIYFNNIKFIEEFIINASIQITKFLGSDNTGYFSPTTKVELGKYFAGEHNDQSLALLKMLTYTCQIPIYTLNQLSHRELEILSEVGEGYKRKAIADKISLQPKTVDTYIERILVKVGLKSIHQLRNSFNRK